MTSDQRERDKAISTEKNVVVTAGAGTGKTALLVSKILHKVLEEGLDIRSILALTFTEKAASEMRLRIEDELKKSGHKRAAEALAGVDRAEIGTIHGFCAHLLREFPLEAGVDPEFVVDDGRHARRLFDREWPLWLDTELKADSPRRACAAEPSAAATRRRACAAEASATATRRREEWGAVLDRFRLEELREVAQALTAFSIPESAIDEPRGPEALEKFGRIIAQEPELEKSAEKLREDIERIDEPLMARVRGLLGAFARDFRDKYRHEGYLSFSGMLSLACELLLDGAFPEPREVLKEKYRFILVDEFQDTDPAQCEIILYLAEKRGKMALRPEAVELEPGKLFIVGDPKQSIYSFRGADIIAYHQVRDQVLKQGGESVVLSSNFRSHRGIIDLVNTAFEGVIRERGHLQPKYEAIEPLEDRVPRLPLQKVELHLIRGEDGKISADEARRGEAEILGDWIVRHVNREDLPQGRVRYKHIGVLFRALTDVTIYLEALRARDIPFVVDGEKTYYETPEVIDFVNLLRAVANPFDKIALVGLLRSPLGALTDDAIYALKRAGALDTRRDPPNEYVRPLYALLRSWHSRAGQLTVPALIEAIFEESPILELASRGFHGEQAVANLLKLRQKAFELESEGGVTLAEFLSVVRESVRDILEESESPLVDETLDAVRIMSIHKAKGLEFPIVFLPDLHRQPAAASRDAAVRYDWPTRTLGLHIGDVFDAGGAALSYLDRERRREEDRRLFYVAMTRARETLVLSGSADHKADTYLGLLESVVPRATTKLYSLSEHVRGTSAAPPPRKESVEESKQDWNEFAARWKKREERAEAARVERITSPSRLEEKERPRIEHDEVPRSSRGAEIGIACHQVLEELNFTRPEVPPGLDPEAASILNRFFLSPGFAELASAEILARELPFVMPHDGAILQGVIDVVYRVGKRVIVADYKTDAKVAPEEYALIRDLYVRAVERTLGLKVSAFKLFYLRHDRVIAETPSRRRGAKR